MAHACAVLVAADIAVLLLDRPIVVELKEFAFFEQPQAVLLQVVGRVQGVCEYRNDVVPADGRVRLHPPDQRAPVGPGEQMQAPVSDNEVIRGVEGEVAHVLDGRFDLEAAGLRLALHLGDAAFRGVDRRDPEAVRRQSHSGR